MESGTLEVAEELTESSLTFGELGLSEEILRAVRERGYETPTPIQIQAIPLLLRGRDVIGGSQTGTGKTAAFAFPILMRLKRHGELRALVIEPTRELARQVYDAFKEYGKFYDLRPALLYGGVKYGQQLEQLRSGADIVVATPGRLLDHLGQKALSLKHVTELVIDEADRMLDMGFLPDVRKIVKQCPPKNRQTMLFSATTPPEISRLASWVLKNPERVTIGTGTSVAETVSHAIYPVDDRQKFDLLAALLDELEYKSVLIFCRTRVGADIIARWLEAAGHPKVAVLHSDRTQGQRTKALQDFKSGRTDILVATDIVARGIDISGISHVVNYDIPQYPEDYVHRIGRTGRACQAGDAVTLFTAGEEDFLKAVERYIGQEIPRRQLEGFDYKWSPVLQERKPPKNKRRNRGYATGPAMNMGRRGRKRR